MTLFSNRAAQAWPWLTALFALVLLTGCDTASAEPAAQSLSTATPPPAVAVVVESTIAPVVVYTEEAPPTPMPSFSLATATPEVKPEANVEAKPAVTEAPSATPTATATPLPTFTPPALPGTSPNEHYWLRRPVPEGGVVWTNKTYPYGSTRGGELRPHHGVEFDVPSGTPMLAAASGTVVVAGSDDVKAYGSHTDFYGNLVVIELDTKHNGEVVFILYGHLSEIFVREGQHVDAEEIIAYSGATGVADGSHLHFEVRVGRNDYFSTRNPLLWLYPFPDHGTVAGTVTWPDGSPVYEAPIYLRRVDASSKYAATTSYADGDLNADADWQENFVLDDVVAGYYEIEVRDGEKKYKQEFWVYPYQTSFVEIVLE